MGYAMFASEKLLLRSQLNTCQLLQTQYSDQQTRLATDNLNLSQQLTSIQASESSDLSDLYTLLAAVSDDEGIGAKPTAPDPADYADGEDDEDYISDKEIYDSWIDSYESTYDSLYAIASKYGLDENSTRDDVEAIISATESDYEAQNVALENEIYEVSVKENAIEQQVKRLDTKVTVYQQNLDAMEQAEGSGIQGATPKFSGIS